MTLEQVIQGVNHEFVGQVLDEGMAARIKRRLHELLHHHGFLLTPTVNIYQDPDSLELTIKIDFEPINPIRRDGWMDTPPETEV